MKHILYFILIITCCKVQAQQNEDFKKVSDYFKFHKKAIAEDFENQIKTEKNLIQKVMLESTMLDFAKRMDSMENNSYTYALIASKNKEVLKPKQIKIKKQNKKIEDNIASYPGGFQALRQEIHDIFYYSARHETPVSYETKVKFQVNADGYITNVTAEGENSVFNKQAEIAIYRLQHPFIPQYKDGYPIKSWFSLPIKMTF